MERIMQDVTAVRAQRETDAVLADPGSTSTKHESVQFRSKTTRAGSSCEPSTPTSAFGSPASPSLCWEALKSGMLMIPGQARSSPCGV